MTIKALGSRLLALGVAFGVIAGARDAHAQLDPLLYLKRTKPNVLLVVETSQRMQRDATNPDNYIDANVYTRTGQAYEGTLGVSDANTNAAGVGKYRRKYINLQHSNPGTGDKFEASSISIVGDRESSYGTFDARTRLAIARRAMDTAILQNYDVARFGLIKMRQNTPQLGAEGNSGPVKNANALQLLFPTDTGTLTKWNVTRPTVAANNSTVGATVPLVRPDAANANNSVRTTLSLNVGQAGALTPGGNDDKNTLDVPLDNMLDDAKDEVVRLAAADTECRNTVVVLIVGGGEGTTTAEDPAAKASQFLNIGSNHRVPVYVIAIAPAAADVTALRNIATNSGGQYIEITSAIVSATTAGVAIPEFVNAINLAVSHAFAAQSDFDTDPPAGGVLPYGPATENQVTSPIIGTVDLEGAKDITGAALPNDVVFKPNTSPAQEVPQRSNVLVTSAFRLPGFDGRLRAFRVYKPVADSSKTSGYKFVNDGTRLWIACAPGAAPAASFTNDVGLTSPCSSLTTASRNIYTALPDGSMIAFTTAQATTLAQYLYPTGTVAEATTLISYIRSQPLGAVVDSTPAIMDAPSLDPPPDSDYPAFSDANEGRRSLVWVGTNDGMLHAIDGRTGVEVWAFIPFNLLPKLKVLREGQSVGSFNFFVDGSPKVSDVKIDGAWRTYLIMGEGPGGTFYQTFDVTLDGMAGSVGPTADVSSVITYFSDITRIPLKWTFPRYSKFDVTIAPYGDVATTASDTEKTVGETWSDPAVGQIESTSGPFAVLTGSGFLKYSTQQLANRGGIAAGTTFYILNAKDGSVLATKNVGNDNKGETVDSCVTANDCTTQKNALQADPVATGPPDSRFITKAYLGDLDGRIWRFDIKLDGAGAPSIPTDAVKIYDMGEKQPNFASMATVNIGSTQQYLFQGTGSELLPTNNVSYSYSLFVILDTGASGTKKAQIDLTKTDSLAQDEKVTAFPAVAGDIVFFSTTSYFAASPCTLPNANLYAFTFIGGPAYDTNASGNLTSTDSTKIRTSTGARASAPFIVDQHVVFSAGGKIEMFGDNEDFNNGVGQAGVRILSWREVR
jgi:hypothetical protein